MTVMDWSEALRLGVEEMDLQHQRLIELINRLHDLHEAEASAVEQGKTLDELAKFCVEHFTEEEAYMERVGFAGLAAHKHIHQQLLEEFTEHSEAFEKTGAFTSKFFSFLKLWLKAHINGIDRQYADA